MVEIRQVGPDDWELVRRVRLRALQDAPLYFWATYEEESQLPEDAWRDRFMSAGAWFMAFAADDDNGVGEPVGLAAAATWEDLPPGTYQVISMWVAPEARGGHIGERLVLRLIEWARGSGVTELQLEYTSGNDAAARLYQRCGFRPTGKTQPHPRDPALREVEMTLRI
jgi:GNAT superfamily N-acetyltransferase